MKSLHNVTAPSPDELRARKAAELEAEAAKAAEAAEAAKAAEKIKK